MSAELIKNKEDAKEITSLSDFIKAIKDVTSGTALYRQVIHRFINKIESKSIKEQGKA